MIKRYLVSDLFFMEKGLINIIAFVIGLIFIVLIGVFVFTAPSEKIYNTEGFILIFLLSVFPIFSLSYGVYKLVQTYERAKLKSYLYKNGIREKAIIIKIEKVMYKGEDSINQYPHMKKIIFGVLIITNFVFGVGGEIAYGAGNHSRKVN